MKHVIVFILIVLLTGITLAHTAGIEKTVPLPELEKPNSITVDNNQIYITDQGSIYIFSLKNYKLIKRFGRIGEGPGEFKLLPQDKIGLRLLLHDNSIIVNSTGKISFFSKTGEFIKEVALPELIQFFKPLGNNYVGFKQVREKNTLYMTVNLYDLKEFQVQKEIFRRRHYGQPDGSIENLRLAAATKNANNRGALFHVYNNQLYVEGNDSEILVFNTSGMKQRTIRPSYEKIKIPDSFKQNVMAFFKKRYPTIHKAAKLNGSFPDFFPIRDFIVADSKIYVLTFKTKANKSEFYILNLDGRLIKKIFIPFTDAEFLLPTAYTIAHNTFYQLTENEDTGDWQLFIHKIAM